MKSSFSDSLSKMFYVPRISKFMLRFKAFPTTHHAQSNENINLLYYVVFFLAFFKLKFNMSPFKRRGKCSYIRPIKHPLKKMYSVIDQPVSHNVRCKTFGGNCNLCIVAT